MQGFFLDSDIRSRLKFLFNREGLADRRNLRIVEELTSRLSQTDIVRMMDRLSVPYTRVQSKEIIDACLASNIIEVGVDIDRLSLMGVIGQPKTTATYIQVTGRVGRRWWERPGLIMTIYNPSKSRDRSHFEQFHSYHRRLYERVEPASATPFAISAMQRGAAGALIAWARQNSNAPVQEYQAYSAALDAALKLLVQRSDLVQDAAEDRARSRQELERIHRDLEEKWRRNPQWWEDFPQKVDGEYLMLWPGQYATALQKRLGTTVPSSLRQVDRSAELIITQGYVAESYRRSSCRTRCSGRDELRERHRGKQADTCRAAYRSFRAGQHLYRSSRRAARRCGLGPLVHAVGSGPRENAPEPPTDRVRAL